MTKPTWTNPTAMTTTTTTPLYGSPPMVLPRTEATPSDMQDQYTYTEARLQAMSEELGRNFRAAYRNPAVEWDEWNQALDAYKAVRRLMPTKPDGKRLGHLEAHLSTQ